MANAFETQLWAIALRTQTDDHYLKSKTEQLAAVYPFRVPARGLRVGTLDSLMALSDDLVKIDMLSESTVMKIYRQLYDLKGEEPTINGVKIDVFTTKQWEWDEAKFQMKTPLRELSESISGRIGGLDEELKMKVLEVNNLKGVLQGYERKTQGNLMVRALTDIVKSGDIQESEFMTTVLVVVPRHSFKEFGESYEKLATYVVPRSARLLSEDPDYGLYRVVCLKKTAEEFKNAAREKRYNVREFTFESGKAASDEEKKIMDQEEFARLQQLLVNWCAINFAEAYTMMLHLKAIRIFVESVLRYGLKSSPDGMRPDFKAFILAPKRGKAEALRKLLGVMYGGSANMLEDGGEADAAVPGAVGEFYPYVNVAIETAPVLT
ncbi:hypothetical protein AB1Y20_008614 [Prymnesium parvum]|uniref:V-type proton ATPase subunit C n=1 Tax=Prymnesium parvum TaxID=97485 RepID=A0AB34ITP9_PRYPA|mmetsp:Transcript_223/g.612  ORF Transcript_223/g.612 Transcript_223/m.612 type:complete len:379 (+) Transcript_223:32-1168(+)|eukprot:CAMPEP_0182820282 /NCGR_PEP_ID=MMETSP0006_2-20121128/13045_1 /TAXON_ID=97485 /ORGANISM="Prymnesium parvum, Strain Texoma1" /LENGTH=378 /DNA_ID=CAMNT_0024946945 /DNA_START=26 /DNA_END=1162 /DNA_ORIENTATION=-